MNHAIRGGQADFLKLVEEYALVVRDDVADRMGGIP